MFSPNVRHAPAKLLRLKTAPRSHWRRRRRGCRGHIPQYFGWGDVNGNIPPILLRTFGYSRPILVALHSLSLKPISFGYKTPPIRFSQAGGQSAHEARPPNLELTLTPLLAATASFNCQILKIYISPERIYPVAKRMENNQSTNLTININSQHIHHDEVGNT